MTISRYNSKSIRIMEQLIQDIRDKKFVPGVPLPSDSILAKRYSISRNTLLRVREALCRKGELICDNHKNLWIPTLRKEEKNDSPFFCDHSVKQRIGVLIGGTYDSFFYGLMEGIGKYCQEHKIYFHRIPYNDYFEAVTALRTAQNGDINGLLISPLSGKEYCRELRRLLSMNFPVVAVDRKPNDINLPVVKSDHTAAVFNATRLLLSRFERSVYYFGSAESGSSADDEYNGYLYAMMEAGRGEDIKTHTHRVIFSTNHIPLDHLELCWQAPFQTALEWLPKIKLPASIFASDDYVAQGIYQAARQLGIDFESSIKIIGLGNLLFSEYCSPKLASFAHDSIRLGEESVRVLENMIYGKIHAPFHINLPMRFVERDSCR